MSPQVFYRKWRPQTLSEVAGQEHVTQTLLQSLATGHISHAYLFSGPRGTGKTSTGRILAKAVNCLTNGHGEPCNKCAVCQSVTDGNSMDVVEIDAASNRGIDDIRSLRDRVAFVPGASHYKVYIIDEVHMLSEPAANALLKTLEEPPPHVIFILATTDPHKMPATILSRCQHFQFHRLTQTAVAGRLAFICEKEGVTAPIEALRLIARSSTGSLRDAENILEQTVAYYGLKLELAQVKELLGLSGDLRAREMARHILQKNLPAGLDSINQANSDGLDLRQFLKTLVDYMRGLLLLKAGASDAIEVGHDELAEMKTLAESASMDSILQAVKLFSQIDMRMDNYSTLPLELALVESVVPQEDSRPTAGTREATKQQSITIPRPTAVVARPAQPVARTIPTGRDSPSVITQRETTTIKPEPKVTVNNPTPLTKVPEPATSTGPSRLYSENPVPGQVGTATGSPTNGAQAADRSGQAGNSSPSGQEHVSQIRPVNPVSGQAGITAGSPVAATSAAPATPRPVDAPPLDYLRLHWREFINSLRGEGSTGTLDTLLRSACEPVAIEGENVVLGFYWPFHKEKIEDPKYCFLIERKLNQFLSGSYKLRCVLTEKKQRPSTGAPINREQAGQNSSASSPRPRSDQESRLRESPISGQTADRSGQAVTNPAGVKKSPGHLVEAALKEGGRIINVEEK